MSDQHRLSTKKELLFSLISAILFLIVSLPVTYSLTNAIFSGIGYPTVDANKAPTLFGILLHFVVFFLLSFGIMKLSDYYKNKNENQA